MILFTLIILSSLFSTGYLKEINNADDNLIEPDVEQSAGSDWQSYQSIQGNFYGQEQRNFIPKPCSRRSYSESEPIKQQVSPAYRSTIDKALSNDNTPTLKPHALRNGDYNLPKSKIQEPPPYLRANNDDNNLYETKNILPVSNPVIDSFEELHREVLPINNEEESVFKPIIKFRSAQSSDLPPSPSALNNVQSPTRKDFHPKPTNILPVAPSNTPENNYRSIPNHVITPEQNAIYSKINNDIDSVPSTNFISDPTNDLRAGPEHVLPFETVNDLRSESDKPEPANKLEAALYNAASELPDKCTHIEEPKNEMEQSRRSMSNYNDKSIKDNLDNDKELLHNDNNQYVESRIDNENAMASVLNEKPPLKIKQDQNLRNFPVPKMVSHKKIVSRVGRPQLNDSRRELIEPTRGRGVTSMAQSSLVLMQTEMICYACSTANNPYCWAPDRRTTVKYCRKGNNACITKTFGSGSTFTLIRDCGRSCDDSEMGGLMPKYKSCSMCHTELCNGAYSINGHSIIIAILLIPLIKYLN